jgi:hypothetical protein
MPDLAGPAKLDRRAARRPKGAMAEIHRFSLVYDPTEDRIAWDMEDTEGAGTRLWLTQRFCKALIAALTPMVAEPVTAAANTAPDAGYRETLQSWEQAAAMSAFGKTPAVRHTPQATSALVNTVHLQPAGETLTFVFEFGSGEQRRVGVDRMALRQTLQVLHRLHTAAGWPTDDWPAWITEVEAAPPDAPRH